YVTVAIKEVSSVVSDTASNNPMPNSHNQLQVVAGENNLIDDEGTEQVKNIQEIIIHENYSHAEYSNDIALLKLTSPLTYNDYVQKVFLSEQDHAENGSCIISGWGQTSGTKADLSTLIAAEVTIIHKNHCRNYYGEQHIDETKLCAVFVKEGVDACMGDRGGPLICTDTGEEYLAGLSSWGKGCIQPEFPE
ncbi:Trypsin-2, partial [Halocaridina rubra]